MICKFVTSGWNFLEKSFKNKQHIKNGENLLAVQFTVTMVFSSPSVTELGWKLTWHQFTVGLKFQFTVWNLEIIATKINYAQEVECQFNLKFHTKDENDVAVSI